MGHCRSLELLGCLLSFGLYIVQQYTLFESFRDCVSSVLTYYCYSV